jgi:hypothetical protein
MSGAQAWRLGPTPIVARQRIATKSPDKGRKVHLAKDTATSDIQAVEFAPRDDDKSPVLPELLDQIPEREQIGTVTADGAYDIRRCHTAIIDRQATPIIPIRKNGRPWKKDYPATCAHNEALRASRIPCPNPDRREDALAGSLEPVTLNLLDLKAFGESITARDPDRQTAEIQIGVALMNCFPALGTAEIIRLP